MKAMLPMGAVLRLAVLDLRRNGRRTVLSLAVIATGVIGLILAGGFVQDLIFQLGEAVIHSQSGHLQVARSGYFEQGSRSPAKYLMSPRELEGIDTRALPHVRESMRRISFSGLLSNGRSGYPIAGEGIEPDPEARLGTYLVMKEGRSLSGADRYGTMIGEGVARALNLRLGSIVSVVAPTIDEAMNTIDLEVVGIFQSFSKDYDDRTIKIPLAAAQELLDTDGVNVVVLLLDDTAHTWSYGEALGELVRAHGLEVKTWDWLNDFYWKTVELYDRQFGVLRMIVLVMVLLAVAGIINMAVFERIGEFGTMRALGNTSWDVVRLCTMEAAVLGMLGAVIGAAAGIAAAWAISSWGIPMPPPPNSNIPFTAAIRVMPFTVTEAMTIAFVATLLASVPAALRVSRMPIAEALRRLA